MKAIHCIYKVMGVLRKIRTRYSGIMNLIYKQLKLMFICFLFLSISINNIAIDGEGFFILDEVNSSLSEEDESSEILCIQDGYLYLNMWNFSEPYMSYNYVKIIDVHQPDNPVITGIIEFENGESLVAITIKENIAYILMELWVLCYDRYFLTLVDITDPANPVRLGNSTTETIVTFRAESPQNLRVYKNYTYVSADELFIFDCSNHTLPVKVNNLASTGGELHIKNDFLYLVYSGVRIYNLVDPVHPLLLGEVNSTKQFSVGSGVYGDYVVNVFREFGLESYDCTDPAHPNICWDYIFPSWKIGITGIVHDTEIVEDRLFAGGDRLYIFNIRKPQKPKRIAWIHISDHNITRIMVENNYLYLTIQNNITIYSYLENSLERNIGLGIGIPLSVVIGISVVFWWKKKRR
ncbi:MAG: hypothetical protein FK733_09455 [Asgard group archaeon]|nr:hypothetical protein [Asgard group archaeon]